MERILGGALLLVLCLLLHVETVTATPGADCTDISSCDAPGENCTSDLCVCDTGYTQSDDGPSCIIVACTGLTSPTNGVANPSSVSIQYDTTVAYTCNAGYTLSGSSTRRCQSNGQLNGNEPFCNPISCTGLTSPTNGVANPSSVSIQYDTTVSYTCNAGYTLSGSNTRRCQSNGQLNGNEPFCNPISCTGLTSPTNGVANPSSVSIQYDTTVSYTCNAGYTLSGSNTRRCQSNGQLNGNEPFCNPISCTGLTSPTNGVANPSSVSIQYDTTVAYTCNAGYTLSGSSTRRCQSNGQLNGNEPFCNPISCTGLTSPTNGVANPSSVSIQYDTTVAYTCNAGYTLSGSSTRRCQSNGQLNGNEPFCNPISCTGLTSPTNGVANPSSTFIQYDTTVTYTCNAGYTLSGSSTRRCQSDGQLSGNKPSCNIVSCTGLTSPTNGVANPSSTFIQYDTTVTYTCNAGYTLSGSSTRRCQSNGQLNGNKPFCNPIYCRGLTSPTNGVANPSSTFIQYSSSVTYTCNAGYTFSGSGTRTCQSDGQLSGNKPSCNIVYCTGLTSPTNGVANPSSTYIQYLASVTYTCNTGYTLSGSSPRTCQSNGQLSGSQPSCIYAVVSLGKTCTFDDNCQASDTNSFCSGGTCVCKTTHFDSNGSQQQGGTCTPNKPLGEGCSNVIYCSDPNAACIGTPLTCTCKDGFFDNNGQTSAGTCTPTSLLRVTNIQFENVATTSMSVTWSHSEYSNFVDEYRLSHRRKDMNNVETVSVGTNTRETLTGLDPGAAYVITVTSINKQTADTERSTHVQKERATKPNKPNGALSDRDLDASDRTITFSWPGSSGPVSMYGVTVTDGEFQIDQNFSQSRASLYSLSFKNGFTYNYAIIAFSQTYFDGTDRKEKSDSYRGTFKTVVTVPGPPTNVICQEPTDEGFRLEWVAPSLPNGDLIGYKIEVNHFQNNSLLQSIDTLSIHTTYTIRGLQPGSYYKFRVFTINEQHTSSSYADSLRCATRAQMSGPPTSIIIENIRSRNMTVTWRPPVDTKGEHLGTSIQVYRTEDNHCIHEYIQRCTNCTITLTNLTESTCDTKTPLTVTSNILTGIQSQLLELLPAIEFTVFISAINAAGRGSRIHDTASTLEEVPQKPFGLDTSEINSTSFKLTWNIPDPRPGNTTFTLTLSTDSPAPQIEKTITGFSTRAYVVNKLEENWGYNVSISAYTAVGSAKADQLISIKTLQAVPGPVDAFERVFDTTTYHDVTVKWKIPSILNRNGDIERYIFSTNATVDESQKETNVTADKNLAFEYVQTGVVTPEKMYSFSVVAVNPTIGPGEKIDKTVMAPAGPPPSFDDTNEVPIVEPGASSTSSLSLTIDTGFTSKTGNGQIREHGLVVAQSSTVDGVSGLNAITDLDKFRSMNNWAKIQKEGFTDNLYRATSANWLENASTSNRRRRQTQSSVMYNIGAGTGCNTDSNSYCNGHLPSDIQFVVVVIACTNGGCTSSNTYGPYRTKAVPVDDDKTGLIIGLVVAAVVVIVLAIILVIVIRRRRRPSTTKGGIEDDSNKLDNLIPRSRPIKMKDFPDHVTNFHRDSNLNFSAEYDDLKTLTPSDLHSHEAAERDGNNLKNRYINILPFDHSRVKLSCVDDDESTDYINGNYLPGFNSPREYLATQGAIPATIDDFWRMVWEQNVNIIVMLTLCKEESRIKCEQYWPSETNEPKQYGDIVVETTSLSNIGVYDIRVFKVSQGNVQRQMKHFHFLSWKDFSANVRNDVVINFIKHVRSHIPPTQNRPPMIVHCSAGVGRTGTYVAIDHLMQDIEKYQWDHELDVFKLVLEMRNCRPYMVQTEQQYVFVHDCLKEIIEEKQKAEADTENLYVNSGQQEHIYGNQGFEPDNEYMNVDFNTIKTEL